MGPIEFIYRWFVSLFGNDLADYLSGWDCTQEAYIGTNFYTSIGIVAVAIALVMMLVYYYLINSATYSRWYHWVIVLLIVGISNFLIGYFWTSAELPNIGDCMMYLEGDKIKYPTMLVTEKHCWLFGLANFFVSVMFFIVFSFAFKWWSKQAGRSPF